MALSARLWRRYDSASNPDFKRFVFCQFPAHDAPSPVSEPKHCPQRTSRRDLASQTQGNDQTSLPTCLHIKHTGATLANLKTCIKTECSGSNNEAMTLHAKTIANILTASIGPVMRP